MANSGGYHVVITSKIPAFTVALRNRLRKAVEEAAKQIRETAHAEMEKPKSGNTYLIGGKLHTASAPGEAPAILTGRLYDSIEEFESGEFEYTVPAKPYWAWWEFGMRGPGSERPYFQPAIDKLTSGHYRDIIIKQVREAVASI